MIGQRIEIEGHFMLDEDMAILDDVSRATGVTPSDILSRHRTTKIVAARFEFFSRLSNCGYSASEIAHMTGRHHTTVLYAINTHRARRQLAIIPAPISTVSCVDQCREWDEVLP